MVPGLPRPRPVGLAGTAGSAPRGWPARRGRTQVRPYTGADRTADHRAAGQPAARPDELVHVDIKKLGNIPDGGGHRVLDRAAASATARPTATPPAAASPRPAEWATATCTPPWTTTPASPTPRSCPTNQTDHRRVPGPRHRRYTAAGITIEHVISDNGGCYRSRDWAAACAALGITLKRTRPYRPQTNGKVERYHRTLAEEWAYARPYTTETERRAALDPWLHTYNHHRGQPRSTASHPPAASQPLRAEQLGVHRREGDPLLPHDRRRTPLNRRACSEYHPRVGRPVAGNPKFLAPRT